MNESKHFTFYDNDSFESVASSSSESIASIKIQVNRSITTCQDVYNNNTDSANNEKCKNNESKKTKLKKFYKNQLRQKFNFKSILFGFIPILNWLPQYKWKIDFLSDLISSTTVLALNIPQGLAYGHLAGVGAINGLYVSLFPLIIYSIFGTSRHISIGTFSVISIACKDVIESIQLETEKDDDVEQYKPIDILITLCLLIGIIQVILGIMRLGILSIILSDTLVSAFIVGSAIHVFTNQIFDFIGIESKNDNDYQIPKMDIFNAYISFFSRIHKTNFETLYLSIICITLLVSCKYLLEPFLLKLFKWKTITIPIDITLVIVITIISYYWDFNGNYNIHVILDIPKGFTGMPKIPDLKLIEKLIPKALLICFISYLITLSLGKMYGKKFEYKVDANQELIALGMANIFSSFFLCFPCCASLSRSAVQERVGGRTQLVSIMSSIFMVILLLFLSTYLRTLPKCVLSCIICVALISTLRRFRELKQEWQKSKLDGLLWFLTFLMVIFFGVDNGLIYAIVISFIILILKLIIPTIRLKYRAKDTEIFLDSSSDNFKNNYYEQFIYCLNNNTIVFEYQGPLIFINALYFRNRFFLMIGKHFIQRIINFKSYQNLIPKYSIILDCSRITNIDAKGCEALLETIELMNNNNIKFLLSSCSSAFYHKLKIYNFFDKYDRNNCFISIIDAITWIKNNNQ